ncbi:MAG: hypothetical protein LBC97_15330 [Bifidobacteriaceae bacterium]|nr:hypothetical protein [Bifidobacteriaceae bacterium]
MFPRGPILEGESYALVVTIRDQSGQPVEEAEAVLEIGGEDCEGLLDGEDTTFTAETDELGQGWVWVEAEQVGVCEVSAYIGNHQYLSNSPLEIAWVEEGELVADPSKTTVVITPSNPPGDPAGKPSWVPINGSYQIEVSAFADDGVTPVPGAHVLFNFLHDTWATPCLVAVRPEGSATATPDYEVFWGRTGADGKLRFSVEGDPNYPPSMTPTKVCVFWVDVDGEPVERYGEEEESYLSESILAFLSAPDVEAERTFYSVSAEEVAAGGTNSGLVEVRFSSSTGAPALPDLSKLTVSGPAGSGLVFGEFAEVPEEEEYDEGRPTGIYQASFTGTKAGNWPVQVLYDNQPIALEEDANAIARITGGSSEPSLDLRVSVAHRCMGGKAFLTVTAFNDTVGVPARLTISSVYGVSVFDSIAPGKSGSQSFTTRVKEYGPGSVTVSGVGLGSSALTGEVSASYSGSACA